MGKGVKKIQYAGGKIYKSKSIPDKSLLVPAGEYISFKVKEWESETKEEDKKKNLMWIWQSNDKPKFIIGQIQVSSSKLFRFMIPKKLCGPYSYYIEASLSGKRSIKNTGIYVTGYTQPLIVNSKWCTRNDGVDVRKSKKFSYGEVVYLNLDTEGLNGFRGLVVEIYNRQTLKSDKKIFTYSNVNVTDGEINLELPNTNVWQGLIDNIREEEEFYIKIKDGLGKYIPDPSGDVAHGRYLRIKNQLIKNQPKKPANLTPVKVGQTEVKKKRDELCKFEEITITETEKKDGKVEQTKISVFKEGQSLVGVKNPQEIINRTIFFEFDQAVLTPKSIEALDNVLNFLLSNPYTTITIDGYACIIGKAEYNKELSLKRSEAVKKHFINGGLNPKLLRCNAKGEIQLNSGKRVGGVNDDEKGKDNLVYKDEKNYVEARRVDISFLYTGHDAKTIVYETIAPSYDKDILVDVLSFESKACFSQKKHKKQIKVTSAEYKEKEGKVKQGDSMQVPVHSALAWWNVAPIQYIWPKWNLGKGISGNGIDAAVLYNLHVHSCRYFSNDQNATVLIKAYPDIKWELAFEIKIDIKHYSHTNMPSKLRIFERHQQLATKNGYKRYLLNKDEEVPITLGFGLSAEWDEEKRKVNVSKEWEKKIEAFAKYFAKTIELVQDGINVCRGLAKSTSIPVSFGVEYPKIEATFEWKLKRAKKSLNELAIGGTVNFGAKPLIGANVSIDLIAAAVSVASYFTTGSPAIAKIVEKVRSNGKKVGAEITAEAKFYGNLEVLFKDMKFNTIDGWEGSSFVLIGGKMGMRLMIEGKVGNSPWYKKKKPKIEFSAIARATGDAYFGGTLKIDYDDTKKSMYIEPTLKFSGLEVVLEAEVTIGWFKESGKLKYEEVVPSKEIKFEKKYI